MDRESIPVPVWAAPYRFHRCVTVTFPVANVKTEIMHLCGEVPHGVLKIRGAGLVKDEPGQEWTKTLAYLRSDTVGPMVLLFVVLQEDPIDVNP